MRNPEGSPIQIDNEIEKKDMPEFELGQWLEAMGSKINRALSEKEKAIVNISGASASGKGEATEALAQQLRSEGKRVLVFSTDDFYKGISRMMCEGMSEELGNQHIDTQQLADDLREIIGDSTFDEKLSEENIFAVNSLLKKKYPNADPDLVVRLIQEQFSQLDFDNPNAVDLPRVAEILGGIRQNESVSIPEYSMKVSEPTGSKDVAAEDYDVILIEGIYGLNPEVLGESDVKSFIEADPKTLLMRRFRRDVLSGRTSFPPDVALWITLEIVLPAYRKHILPNREEADMVLKNDYTGNETFDTEHYDVQDKIKLELHEVERIAQELGEPEIVSDQHDYFFASREDDDLEHLIRLRVENGRLKDLVHKGTVVRRDDGKVVRPTEEFIKDGQFGIKYNTEEEVIEAFKKGGFIVVADISKTRKTFRKGEVEVVIDSIESMGDFIELRTNDKLSKSPEVDRIEDELGISGRAPVGPYVDEYLRMLKSNPELAAQQEVLLNQGLSKEIILESGMCEVIENTEAVIAAFNGIRKGYPESPTSEQCSGREFRDNSRLILDQIVGHTMSGRDKDRIVALFPWRSGIAFAKSFSEQGVNNFYHLSSKRDEQTLSTVVDYESGSVDENSIVVISDPMLASGNTIVDAVERMIEKGVQQQNIVIIAVVAAPTGIARIKKAYPEVEIVVGALDEKLDHKGYIVPGLGDFGDKYFANLSPAELQELVTDVGLDEEAKVRLIKRISHQGISETLSDLIQRDMKDREINEENHRKLVSEGMEVQKPHKTIKVDTGRTAGVENVVEIIAGEMEPETKIIAIEGSSGTGKSSAANKLRERLNGSMLSLGEVFRYLAYQIVTNKETDPDKIISGLSYKIEEGNLVLYDGDVSIRSVSANLRSSDLESQLPEIASQNQKRVIDFAGSQISHIASESDIKILVEGRAFTLDFLPADLRVKLIADPSIRAERRWNQTFMQQS